MVFALHMVIICPAIVQMICLGCSKTDVVLFDYFSSIMGGLGANKHASTYHIICLFSGCL